MIPRSFIQKVERRLFGMISGVVTPHPAVALTFDDGPDPVYTAEILEVLSKYGALATFFVTGEHAELNRETVSEMLARGHCIGNHTSTHPRLPRISWPEKLREIDQCSRAIGPTEYRLFRPTYGDYDYTTAIASALRGYRMIGWRVSIEDWRERDADLLAQRLTERVRPGDIVLLHDSLYPSQPDSYPKRDALIRALDTWLMNAVDTFQFVTVPQLLALGHPRRMGPVFGFRSAA
jgi:peptidoglycan/xylan/chitin deacetylase (PgdA/CDA1 family)